MNAVRTAYIGLGGNLGSPRETFRSAASMIESEIGRIERRSSLYRTAPLLPPGESYAPDYLNAVIACATSLPPAQILKTLLAVEAIHGRERTLEKRWESRTIDLDLLSVGDEVIEKEGLTLPHPELSNRDFVLVPFAEIAGDYRLPGKGSRISELLTEFGDSGKPAFILERLGSFDDRP